MEDLMSGDAKIRVSGESKPKPTPQWPNITKPDTRGGNGPKK
jgi:hypothetical protein